MDAINEIRQKIEIVDFINGYVPLKRAGKNYKGNCPFHNEKTPSFIVSPDIQRYRCFGCGKSGDVFTFFMEYEGVDFKESLKFLANKAGVTITNFDYDKGQKDKNEIIYKINDATKNFYEYVLHKHPVGKGAIEYLKKRNIKLEVIKEFKIGYAPKGWDNLSKILTKSGYTSHDLVFAGVARYRKSGQQTYDMFRDRIMFPLIDHMGKIVGFAGRGLTSDQIPKYINTQETPIFHKEKFLFGINLAKKYIKESGNAIIVEGEFDMISLYQNGYKNVVASKGTALTLGQVNLIKRYADTAILIFDSDIAGIEASIRGIKIIQNAGLNLKIGIMPNDCKDPDEMMQKDSSLFDEILQKALPLWDYYFYYALQKYDIQNVFERQKASRFLYESLNDIADNVTKTRYIKKFADIFEMDQSDVAKDMQKLLQTKTHQVYKHTVGETQNEDVSSKLLPNDNLLINNPELYFLALILNGDKKLIATYITDIDLNYFANPVAKQIFETLQAEDLKNFETRAFYAKIADSIHNSNSLLERLYLVDLGGVVDVPEVFKKEIIATKSRLARAYHTQALKNISKALKLSETLQDQQKVAELLALADKHRVALKTLTN